MAEGVMIGWVVEPKNGGTPYLTFKADVAAKRNAAGDYVQLIKSTRPAAQPEPEDKEEI